MMLQNEALPCRIYGIDHDSNVVCARQSPGRNGRVKQCQAEGQSCKDLQHEAVNTAGDVSTSMQHAVVNKDYDSHAGS